MFSTSVGVVMTQTPGTSEPVVGLVWHSSVQEPSYTASDTGTGADATVTGGDQATDAGAAFNRLTGANPM